MEEPQYAEGNEGVLGNIDYVEIINTLEGFDDSKDDITKKYNKYKKSIMENQSLCYKLNHTRQNRWYQEDEVTEQENIILNYKAKLDKYNSFIQLDPLSFIQESVETINNNSNFGQRKKGVLTNIKPTKDKSFRATNDQCLDPLTRLILLKLINSQFIDQIFGCLSTGKEANVYLGIKSEECLETPYAIKVYKTSVLSFVDRARYMIGEYRYRYIMRSGMKNPRRMVALWAEKEYRNLSRIYNLMNETEESLIFAPRPKIVKGNVLLMEFLGSKKGFPLPKLKDALSIHQLNYNQIYKLYWQLIIAIWTMVQKAHLIHADMSEFNVLYEHLDKVDQFGDIEGRLYIIDVSQSVELNHPNAFEFLKMDAKQITNFFSKNLPQENQSLEKEYFLFGLKDLFDLWLRSIPNTKQKIDDYLLELQSTVKNKGNFKSFDNEFYSSFVPQTLDEVVSVDKDVKKVIKGDTDDFLYKRLLNLDVDEPSIFNEELSDSSMKKSNIPENVVLSDREANKNAESRKNKKSLPSHKPKPKKK